MKKFLAFVFLALISGCMPGPSFVPYVGVQKHWQTSEGAYVRQIKGIDVYYNLKHDSYPAKPYDILGGVVAFNEGQLVETAKAHNADAVIVEEMNLLDAGTVSTGGNTTTEFFVNTAVTQTSPAVTRRRHLLIYTARVIRYHTP